MNLASGIQSGPISSSTGEIVAEIERRRFAASLNLLKVYNYYRVIVGLSLLVAVSQTWIPTNLGHLAPDAFFWIATLYVVVNLLCAILVQLLPQRYVVHQNTGFLLACGDVLALTLLMYLSGGVASGIGMLILVSVATGNILIAARTGLLLAAIASLAVLYEEFYLSLAAPQLQAGVLGILYFTASLVVQNISTRLRNNEIRALTQAAELADLERINRLIVQRMRTGIVLVDGSNRVRMANQAAHTFLGKTSGEPLSLPRELEQRLEDWRDDTSLRTRPFRVNDNPLELRVNFSPVRPKVADQDVTIFIEDTSEIQQQAQQLKLAGLGRLSASIAHEIRNPLGAISHAAQLLQESNNLDKGDERLTDIIHSHCQRMNGVIENVLELSRRAPPSPQRLHLDDWLQEFVSEFTEAVPEAILECRIEPKSTEIRVDSAQLKQALTNLVQNAIRYSQLASKEPFARLEGGMDTGTDRPYLSVLDNGPGVTEENLRNLFEPFFTTEGKGTGLGLYLSRELCEANQAQLDYVPSRRGACFRIVFAHPDRITA